MTIGKSAWGLGLGGFVLLAAGFGLGHFSNAGSVVAQQAKSPVAPVSANVPAADNKRVVANVFGGTPITREEYGDYLISHYGKERLDLYVNRRIIEIHCAKLGVDIDAHEIEAAIKEDCKRIGVSKDDFIKKVLKERYGKTLAEWQADVMKPRLLLAKLCRDTIQVDEDDLKKTFENRYGAKARVKIILWPKDQLTAAQKNYGTLRKQGTEDTPPKPADFYWDSVAKNQPDATLAARAGEIEPIGRYSGSESAKVEEIAFNLKVGEVSPIIDMPIGYLVVKRIGTVEPVAGANFEKLRAELRSEVVERKLEREIPNMFAKIKEEAKPVLFELGPASTSQR
jgi:hypothetical protein